MAYTPKYVLNEITFPGVVQNGARGMKPRRVQESETLLGHSSCDLYCRCNRCGYTQGGALPFVRIRRLE